MVCRNLCERLYSKIIVGKSPYQDGKKYCRRCEVYFYQIDRFCRCCGMTLRTSSRWIISTLAARVLALIPLLSRTATSILSSVEDDGQIDKETQDVNWCHVYHQRPAPLPLRRPVYATSFPKILHPTCLSIQPLPIIHVISIGPLKGGWCGVPVPGFPPSPCGFPVWPGGTVANAGVRIVPKINAPIPILLAQ